MNWLLLLKLMPLLRRIRIPWWVLLLVALFAAGFYTAQRWFPRLVVQPVTVMVPGESKVERIPVPGPIRYVPRTVTRTKTHYIFVTQPVELPPDAIDKAREKALRRFILSMEIPAGQLIPCHTPLLAEGGVTCDEPIRFQAEILEPKAGVFVPLVIPGEVARPTELRVEARIEATKPVQEATHLFVYPLGMTTWPSPHLVSGLSYQNAGFGGTYQVRAEYHYPDLGVFVGWGAAW